MFVLPPTNHLKNGLFESSSTLSHFWNHSNCSACAPQKPSRSSPAQLGHFFVALDIGVGDDLRVQGLIDVSLLDRSSMASPG